MLTYEVYTPLLAIAGLKDAALWFTTTSTGQFVGMLSVCLIVFIYIAVGMKWYARVQKFCFWGGLVGLAIVFLLLLFGNNATFIANFNALAPRFGAAGRGYLCSHPPGWRRCRHGCRSALPVGPGRQYLPGPDADLLQPVAQLGFHPVW